MTNANQDTDFALRLSQQIEFLGGSRFSHFECEPSLFHLDLSLRGEEREACLRERDSAVRAVSEYYQGPEFLAVAEKYFISDVSFAPTLDPEGLSGPYHLRLSRDRDNCSNIVFDITARTGDCWKVRLSEESLRAEVCRFRGQVGAWSEAYKDKSRLYSEILEKDRRFATEAHATWIGGFFRKQADFHIGFGPGRVLFKALVQLLDKSPWVSPEQMPVIGRDKKHPCRAADQNWRMTLGLG
jgi:hypothetical protein